MISIVKPGKDPTLTSSFRLTSLLAKVRKLFEKILLPRILREVKLRGLLGDEQFGFRLKHSTIMQLARLLERDNRNIREKRLTVVVFLDICKNFDTVWIVGPL